MLSFQFTSESGDHLLTFFLFSAHSRLFIANYLLPVFFIVRKLALVNGVSCLIEYIQIIMVAEQPCIAILRAMIESWIEGCATSERKVIQRMILPKTVGMSTAHTNMRYTVVIQIRRCSCDRMVANHISSRRYRQRIRGFVVQ